MRADPARSGVVAAARRDRPLFTPARPAMC